MSRFSAADGRIDLWRDRVRLELERQTAAGLSGVPETSEGTAKQGTDGDAAAARYSVLETACKVTTSDYNALWESWSKACQIYGCK